MTARQDLTHKERADIQDLLVDMATLTTHVADFRTMRALVSWTKAVNAERGMMLAFAADVDPLWFQRQISAALKHQHAGDPLPGLRVVK